HYFPLHATRVKSRNIDGYLLHLTMLTWVSAITMSAFHELQGFPHSYRHSFGFRVPSLRQLMAAPQRTGSIIKM
ncbi:hypothetical protein EDB82DRAFT_510205, partial [Fusarium venenatum]|uniref:uncharacterized protein n=1 Tax=Fusarium venenatum TaxID=56646 RepID=UPI001E0154AF